MRSTSTFPAFATAGAAIEAVRAGKTSASELVQRTFDRLDRHNPRVNAIVWEDRERAIERARHADDMQARRAEEARPDERAATGAAVGRPSAPVAAGDCSDAEPADAAIGAEIMLNAMGTFTADG